VDPARGDLFWLVAGRVADWGPVREAGDVAERTRVALRGHEGGRTAYVPADAVDEARIVSTWIAGHEPSVLRLDPPPGPVELARFAQL
jgi:hypothetical protein